MPFLIYISSQLFCLPVPFDSIPSEPFTFSIFHCLRSCSFFLPCSYPLIHVSCPLAFIPYPISHDTFPTFFCYPVSLSLQLIVPLYLISIPLYNIHCPMALPPGPCLLSHETSSCFLNFPFSLLPCSYPLCLFQFPFTLSPVSG